MTITALQGQSLLDLAIQTAGAPEVAFDLALANDLSITDELTAGEELILPFGIWSAENKSISAYYAQHNIIPATDYTGIDIFDHTFDFTFN